MEFKTLDDIQNYFNNKDSSFLKRHLEIYGNGIVARMGGKSNIKNEIIDLFPSNYTNMVYVEPFVGGGNILLAKETSRKEVINDIDKDLMIIYKGFKKYDKDKILNAINGVYNKKDFIKIREEDNTIKDGFKKFVNKFLIIRLSFYGKGNSFNSRHGDVEKISMSGNNFDRLKDVKMYNTDYGKVIEKYNNPDTFLYLDPPYEDSNSSHYKHHAFDFERLKQTLDHFRGKFLLSINDSKYIRDLFKDYNISTIQTSYIRGIKGGSQKAKIKELIIRHY